MIKRLYADDNTRFIAEYAWFARDQAVHTLSAFAKVYAPGLLGVMVAVRGDAIVGARVFFDCEIMWVQPPQGENEGVKVEVGGYDDGRKKQSPADCDLYFFEREGGQYDLSPSHVSFAAR